MSLDHRLISAVLAAIADRNEDALLAGMTFGEQMTVNAAKMLRVAGVAEAEGAVVATCKRRARIRIALGLNPEAANCLARRRNPACNCGTESLDALIDEELHRLDVAETRKRLEELALERHAAKPLFPRRTANMSQDPGEAPASPQRETVQRSEGSTPDSPTPPSVGGGVSRPTRYRPRHSDARRLARASETSSVKNSEQGDSMRKTMWLTGQEIAALKRRGIDVDRLKLSGVESDEARVSRLERKAGIYREDNVKAQIAEKLGDDLYRLGGKCLKRAELEKVVQAQAEEEFELAQLKRERQGESVKGQAVHDAAVALLTSRGIHKPTADEYLDAAMEVFDARAPTGRTRH